MSNDYILPHFVKVPLILDQMFSLWKKVVESVLTVHMMHFIRFRIGQPLPQVALRLFGILHLNSSDIEESLAICSYCESYRHQLGDLQEPVCSS